MCKSSASVVGKGSDSATAPLVLAGDGGASVVDARREHYPMCVVWSAIPLLTWLLPVVGHTGVVTSDGTIYDFAGPYYINRSKSRTAFGLVLKYFPVSPGDISVSSEKSKGEVWDSAVEEASLVYSGLMHNLITYTLPFAVT
eukprot:TRINITY_DN4621_c0_g1_i1.p1 TRINITY_DN4621_c0_g1~~TRINITY_DN4621_c0_g1_i1.p1  ORF type:complete len:142 (+),score=41.48 TRINITY_DN4621_c0_g1_i1:3-428(+)